MTEGSDVGGGPVRSRQRRSVLTFVGVVLAVVAGLAVLNGTLDSGPDCDPIPGVRPGVCITAPQDRGDAPVGAAEVVIGDGTVSVADFRGQVLVVNFWAAWCGPCRAEQPVLNDAYAQLAGDDIAFLGVAIQDSRVNQAAHVREFAIPYPSIFDPSNAYSATYGGIGARSIPTTIVIDRQGRVAVRLFGEVRDVAELAALTTRIAGEPSSS